jgi:hypothetical protein
MFGLGRSLLTTSPKRVEKVRWRSVFGRRKSVLVYERRSVLVYERKSVLVYERGKNVLV